MCGGKGVFSFPGRIGMAQSSESGFRDLLLPMLRCVSCSSSDFDVSNEWVGPDYLGESISKSLICSACGAAYPLTNDHIPIMWSEAMQKVAAGNILNGQENIHANACVYDSFSDSYDKYSRRSAEIEKRICNAANRLLTPIRASGGPTGDLLHLDFGCGPGHVIGWLKGFGLTQVGLDVSLANLRNARSKTGALVVCGDAACMPFKERAFTLVTESAVLHHIDDWKSAVAEACRVCSANGGVLLDSEPSTGSLDWSALARFVFDLRLYVYPALSHIAKSKYMFKSREEIELNLKAEIHNQPGGGFDISEMEDLFRDNGFIAEIIQSPNADLASKASPSWKSIILNVLSFHNPWNPEYYPFMVLATPMGR